MSFDTIPPNETGKRAERFYCPFYNMFAETN